MQVSEEELANLDLCVKAGRISEKYKNNLIEVRQAMVGTFLGMACGKKFDFKGNSKIMSFWAFLFGPLAYLARGMWKKAILIMLVGFCFGCVGVVIGEMFDSSTVSNLIGCVFGAYLAYSFKNDCFRRFARKEDFWW